MVSNDISDSHFATVMPHDHLVGWFGRPPSDCSIGSREVRKSTPIQTRRHTVSLSPCIGELLDVT
jgi:hypothetical protein